MRDKHTFTGSVLSFFFLCLSLVYFVGLVRFFPTTLTDSIQMGRGEPVEILVEPGSGARKIAEVFSASGLTDRPHELSRWFAKLGIDRSLRPGLYRIRPMLPGEPKSRLAFMLPETYSVTPSAGAVREVVKSASALWLKRVGEQLEENLFRKEYLLERAIIASLVEKEGRKDAERGIIAGVIENRSAMGMKLQIDATVVYAWALRGVSLNRVLYRDLEIDSPYNTYLFKGLPPAPICIPSEPSWHASLEPQQVPYIYYVAMPDGSHIFTRTYNEHLEAVRRSRKEFESRR